MKVSIVISYFLALVSAGYKTNDKEVAAARKIIKQNNLQSFCVKYVPPQTQTKTHWKTATKYVTAGKPTRTTMIAKPSTVLLTATSTVTATDLKFTTDRSTLAVKQTELGTAPAETVVDATTTTNIITTNAAAPTAITKRAAKKIVVPKKLKKFCDTAVIAACRSINKPVKKTITRTKTRTKTIRCTRTQTNTFTRLNTMTNPKTETVTTSETSTFSEPTTRTSVTTSVTIPRTTVQTTLSTATTTTTTQPSPTGPAALCNFANNPKINRYAYSALVPAPPGQIEGGAMFKNFGDKERCCNACATSSGCAIWQSFDGADCNLIFPRSIKKRAVVPMVKRQNQCPAGMFVGRYDVYEGLEELANTWAGPGPCLSDLQVVEVDWENSE